MTERLDEDQVRRLAHDLAQKKLDARSVPYKVNPHRMDVDAEMEAARDMLRSEGKKSTTS